MTIATQDAVPHEATNALRSQNDSESNANHEGEVTTVARSFSGVESKRRTLIVQAPESMEGAETDLKAGGAEQREFNARQAWKRAQNKLLLHTHMTTRMIRMPEQVESRTKNLIHVTDPEELEAEKDARNVRRLWKRAQLKISLTTRTRASKLNVEEDLEA